MGLSGPVGFSDSFIPVNSTTAKLILVVNCLEDRETATKIEGSFAVMARRGVKTANFTGGRAAGTSLEQRLPIIKQADVILLIITSSFLAKSWSDNELRQIYNSVQAADKPVIPIIASSCGYEDDDFLSSKQVLPSNGKPISSWNNRDDAVNDIATQVRRVLFPQN